MTTQTQGLIIIGAIIVLVVGIIIGRNWPRSRMGDMHRMGDGSMMMGRDMDMESMMQGMHDSLDGKTGDAFDQEFLKQMIVHHQGAVAMAEQVLATSKRPELIKLANDIITAQNGEINMMQDWQKAWFQ